MSASVRVHVCSELPCQVPPPARCGELVHVSVAVPLNREEVVAAYKECLTANAEAVWPEDLYGPLDQDGGRAPAPRRSALRRPRAPPAAAPFDDLPGAEAPDADAPAGQVQARREELRVKLQGAKQRFAEAAAGGGAAAAANPDPAPAAAAKPPKRPLADLLADRAAKVAKAAPAAGAQGAAAAGRGAEAEASGGVQELASALFAVLKTSAAQAASSSDGAAGADALAGSDGSGLPRGLATKRAHCRKLALETPGRLSELTLGEMASFVGGLEGETTVDPTQAIALRYLLTVHLPQNPVQQIGAATYREMRTLSEAVDCLLQGRTAQALDLLTQRLKAVQLAVSDGHWGAAKWLELIPARDQPTTLRNEEEEMVRSIELGELKLEELSAKLRKGPV